MVVAQPAIARKVALAIAVVGFISSWTDASAVGQGRKAKLVVSANGDYLVRTEPGDGESVTATAYVMKYSKTLSAFEFVKKLGLPHRRRPMEAYMSDDGTYFVTIGNRSGTEDLSAAIAIYDLQGEKSRIFALTDLFAIDDIAGIAKEGRYTDSPMGIGQIFSDWTLNRNGRQTGFAFDPEANIIYLTGLDSAYPPEPPTITIDLDEMSVAVGKPSFWKAQHDQLWTYYKEWAVHRSPVDAMIDRLSDPAEKEHRALDDEWLFRLEPGSTDSPCRMLMLHYDSTAKTYRNHKTILLKNLVAPQSFFLSTDARFLVTLDEFDAMGVTGNAVVIYNLETGQSKAFSLEDFFPQSEIGHLPSGERVRLWQEGETMKWLKFKGAEFSEIAGWGGKALGPVIEIDVANMAVRFLEWDRTKERGNGNGDGR